MTTKPLVIGSALSAGTSNVLYLWISTNAQIWPGLDVWPLFIGSTLAIWMLIGITSFMALWRGNQRTVKLISRALVINAAFIFA